MAVGRISGPLLKANLLRDGVDLAFETDLLYLDVVNGRIGVKTAAPTHELTVNGTTRTTNLEVLTQVDIGPLGNPELTINGSTITSNSNTLNLVVTNPNQVVYQNKLTVDDITLNGNVISTNSTDTNLEIRPNGTGEVLVYGNTTVYGDIHATGNITADGDITIGDSNTDSIDFNADVASNIIPNVTDFYTLGTIDNRWNDVWVKNLYSDNIVTGDITVDNINLNLRQGNIIYVATNGSDEYSGTHQNDPFKTIKHALSIAQAGDTVYVYPGTYNEYLPLEVPSGVTVRGESLRAVSVRPQPSTMFQDMFHMNGEATVEDFTLIGFYHDPNGTSEEYPLGAVTGGTGHGFRFSNGATTVTRSPYIRNITVITYGTPSVLSINSLKTEALTGINRIKGIISNIVQNITIVKSTGNSRTQNVGLDSSDGATGALLEDLIDDVVYVINNGTQRANLPTIVANTNPATTGMLYNAAIIIEANREFIKDEVDAYVAVTYPSFIYDHEKTKRDVGYILDSLITDIKGTGNEQSVFTGFNFWQQPTNDPRGFDRGDAGHGAFIDGSIVNPVSKEAAMLFHSVTFLTPAAETLIACNGARVEWLNSFTYFADKGMYLYSTSSGFAGQGKTRLKIPTKTGTWSVGNTVSYYDTDGVTVLASGTIASVDGEWINLTGRQIGFDVPEDRPGKTVSVHGDAKLSTSVKKFGTASLALDGAGDYLSLASSPDFAFGTSDFTIEYWAYRNSNGGSQVQFDFRPTSGTASPYLYAAGTQLIYNVAGVAQITTAIGAFNSLAWHHIALSRHGLDTRLFVDGVQVGIWTNDTTDYIQSGIHIGANYVGTAPANQYFDDFRVTKGVARYTSNFTAPTTAFLGDTSSVLLLHFNGVNGSTAITDDGVTFVDIRTSAGGTTTDLAVADYSDFGAEVRSIGSACVYGNYGIYGDGPGVVAYLIGQNLAYIGNGKSESNDPTTVIQANEIVELNGAKIYYNSVDHRGDFRVGDLFYINQRTGEVTFANSDIQIGNSLTFDDGAGNVTYLDSNKIETGDFRISGNTIQTLTQDFNVLSASDQINLQNNVNIAGNLGVTGNVTVSGNLTLGDQPTDIVIFVSSVGSDIVPKTTQLYSLGTSSYEWKDLYTSRLLTGGISIDTNTITTTTSNTDLILSANGTGRIYVPTNNLQVSQNITVDGTTTLKTTNIGTVGSPATITHIGDVDQTGDLTQTGDISVTGTFTASGTGQFADINISTNEITTTIGNNDLRLLAAGTGRIYIPLNNVQVDNDLTVNSVLYADTLTVTTTVESNAFSTGDIFIDDNVIKTTLSNNNLILQAAGTGKIYVPTNDVQIDNNLTVNGITELKTTNITGTLTHVGDLTQTGDIDQTGNTTITGTLTVGAIAQFTDVKIEDNTITTTIGNNDLQLLAAGTGRIYIPTNDVQIDHDLTVNGVLYADTLTITNTVEANAFSTGDIFIDDNVIKTTLSTNNLILQAAGTGKIYVPTNDVQLDNNLTVNGITDLKTTNITGTITHIGDVIQTGDLTQTGNTTITGTLTVDAIAQFTDVKIEDNTITTTLGNNDLRLLAAGTGRIYVPTNDVQIDNDLIVNGVLYSNTLTVTTTVEANAFSTGDILIDDNIIKTTLLNNDLVLQAAGTGRIYIPTNDVQIDNVLSVNGVTNLRTTFVTGTLTHVGDLTQTGDVDQTGNTTITGTLTVGAIAQFTDVKVEDNTITTTIGNNDLQLLAAGTGRIYIPTNDVQIDHDLTVNSALYANTLNVTTTTIANAFSTGDIFIDDNVIKTTLLNNDLVLQAAGTGKIYVPTNDVQIANDLTVNGLTELNDTNITGILTQTGDVVQTGDLTQTGNTTITGTLTVGAIAQFTDVKIENNTITTTLGNNDLTLTAAGTGKIYVPTNDVEFNQTLTVIGLTSTTDIVNTGTITSNSFTTGDILIDNNVISTTLANSNLVLQPNGNGEVIVPDNNVQFDQSLTVNGTTYLQDVIVSGTITQTGNVTQIGDTEQTGNFTLNGILTVTNVAQFEDIRIENNVITTTISNNDLELVAVGTGKIYVPNNDVYFAQALTVVGTSTTANITNSGTITSGTFSTGNIQITANTISTTVTNSNLQLQANGTGLIELESFQVQENEIYANNDIIITPNGTGIVSVNSNQSIKIPVGSTDDRPVGQAGMLRFNTTLNRFEGFDGSTWIRLDGLADADGNTYITAELTPGANDNTFRFVTNGNQVADLTSTRLNVVQVQVDDININGNTISTTTNTDINIQTSGTGSIKFGNFSLIGNTITNIVSNSNTVLAQTGNSYFKIGDTNGFVIPVGTTEQRPGIENIETGLMRFNTTDSRVEIYDGTQWVSAAGSSGAVTIADAENAAIVAALMLG